MASPELLDFAQLRMPIAGDNPAGKSLREDYSLRSSYQTIKDLQKAARDAERTILWEEDGDPQGRLAASRAGWKPVLGLAAQITTEESKDLQVVSWWIEALLRVHGFAGSRDGFRLARELVEEFWDKLYPLPDDEGIATRVAPLAGLNGVDSDGVLVNPILNLPITEAGSFRAMSLVDYQQASDLERIQDPEKRAQRVNRGAITLEAFQKAVAETSTEFFTILLEDVSGCAMEFDKLGTALEEKCGNDPDGHTRAPPSSNIRNALQAVREQVEQFVRSRRAINDAPAGAVALATHGAQVAITVNSGPIAAREDAFRALMQIADFFRRAEPHSPIPYLLDQAVRWGKMPLPELLNELLPAESIPTQSFKLVGIRLPERKD
ncbi:MAG: type VI secretion system protein TssA [Thermoguttaceae bacterium]